MPRQNNPPPPRFRMSLRDLVIVVVAITAGIAAAYLLIDAHIPWGQAVLGGFGSSGATLYFLDRIAE